ncbi:NAD(P)/FAD-dependent oxidoreductase [Actinophytocola gossypii]|uniref:FAD-dependent oxidoreductase n=1 Tax=Actinophytocola gossypii TaxID=2812003 RepID=A0ABT2J9U0_9PSEU|nr:FAD-dependent oxidoreductase [Actinophytocola gossypii]MCT2584215.1 FAD-dependent oxidoreductase [Actinophytocola gossypii]
MRSPGRAEQNPVNRERIAVVGAGVAGLTAAHLLQRRHDVLLFEAEPRLGGHAHTHDVDTGTDTLAVDTGFIVHNERTYPNLLRLFGELGVRTQDSDMSMSVRCLGCGLEYAGARGPRGLFPTPGSLGRPRYLRMLTEVTRFHRHARRVLAERDDGATLGTFLTTGRYSGYFRDHFLLPMVSAVWSAPEHVSRDYPARYLFEFLANHGLLSVGGSPQWRTVTGGSREYVERAVKNLTAVRVGTPVRAVHRHADHVEVRDDADEPHRVDRVVLATHADQALELLADPTEAETEVLGAFRYSRNETWLHTDATLLPRTAGARASWNYLKTTCAGGERVLVSYDLTRLMRLDPRTRHVVTLNATDRIAPDRVLARMTYEHPVYTRESVAAQRRLPELAGPRTAFAGAYHGWGFHEDGCAAGVRAAEHFGAGW